MLRHLADFTRVAGWIEKNGNSAPEIAATARDLPRLFIIVNGEGLFFYGGGLSDQLYILLHELAHVVEAPGFRKSEQDSAEAQRQNDALLRQKCGKTLRP